MTAKRRTSAKPSRRRTPVASVTPTTRRTVAPPAPGSGARRYYLRSPYLALLLQAIRDGLVRDWASLMAFGDQHALRLVSRGTRVAGEQPSVEELLRQLKDASLITVDGIEFTQHIWVRRDNVTKAPPGRIV